MTSFAGLNERPTPAAVGSPIRNMSLGCAIPVRDGAWLCIFFVALRLPAARGEFAHVILAIAFERGLAACCSDRQ